MARVRFVLFSLLLISSVEMSTAQARAPSPSSGERSSGVERSRALYRQGNEAFRSGELERARVFYQEALLEERAFDILCNLGRTEATLGEDALALTHLDECLKEYPPGEKLAPAREKFFELREEVRARCRAQGCAESAAAVPTTSGEEVPSPGTQAEPAIPEESPRSFEPAAARDTAVSGGASLRSAVSLGLAAAGVLSAGVGVGLVVHAEQSAASATELRSSIVASGGYCAGARIAEGCAEFSERVAQSRDARAWAMGSGALAGTLLGAALLTYWLWPEEAASSEERGLSWRPWVVGAPGWTGASLGIEGRF